MIDEMMEDMMDSAMDEPDLEQETEEEVAKVSLAGLLCVPRGSAIAVSTSLEPA